MITLICRKNGSDVTNFTDGKEYQVVYTQGNLAGIMDDLNRVRYVLPDEISPHLVKRVFAGNAGSLETQRSVGWFETK